MQRQGFAAMRLSEDVALSRTGNQCAHPKSLNGVSTSPVYAHILKRSTAYSLAGMFGKVASLLLLPIYTRYLTPADYGVMELLDITSYTLGTLVGGRFADALLYYYAAASNRDEQDTVVGTATVGSLGIFLVALALGLTCATPISELVFASARYTGFVAISFASLGFSFASELGIAYLRARDEALHFTLISVARLLAAIATNIYFLVSLKLGVQGVLLSSLAVGAGAAVYSVCLMAIRHRMRFDISSLRQQFSFSLPLTLTAAGMMVVHYGDRFFLQRFATLTDVGVYSLAYKIGMLISFIHAPFSGYWTAQMYHLARGERGDEIYVRVFTYFLVVMACAAVLISVTVDPVLTCITAAPFRAAINLVPWLVAAYVVRAIGDHLRAAFSLHNKTIGHAQVAAVGVVSILVLYALLIPRYKTAGAVAATFLSFLAMAVVTLWNAQRIKRYSFEYGRIGRLAVLTTATITTYRFFHSSRTLLQCVGAVVTIVGWTVAVWIFVADANEKKQLVHGLQRTMLSYRCLCKSN